MFSCSKKRLVSGYLAPPGHRLVIHEEFLGGDPRVFGAVVCSGGSLEGRSWAAPESFLSRWWAWGGSLVGRWWVARGSLEGRWLVADGPKVTSVLGLYFCPRCEGLQGGWKEKLKSLSNNQNVIETIELSLIK